MTLREYNIHMRALDLAEVDRLYHIHMQAFQNVRAKAQKKVGRGKAKPAFSRFRQFFDYEKELRKLQKEKKRSRYSDLMDYYRQEGQNGSREI